jgi:hypothetical protein
MTENENSAEYQAGELEERRPSGKVRLLPKVTFGLGTAVLAGVVVVSVPTTTTATAPATGAAGAVATTVGLGAVINAVTGNGIFQTTCCGGRASEL